MKYSSVDNIDSELLKPIIASSASFIRNIVNQSFSQGIFLDCLKTSHIIPVLKKGKTDKNELPQYRPISNIPLLSKILEKCALIQLQEHLESNDLLKPLQSAYRNHHSCETALTKVFNDIYSEIDPSCNVVLVLLDFSSAFDTISHKLLLQKLKHQFALSLKLCLIGLLRISVIGERL